nr:unnamed protein product [Haemonchus contortus]
MGTLMVGGFNIIESVNSQALSAGWVKSVQARIIDLVEVEACLWDHRCEFVGVRHLRNNAWNRIFRDLKAEGVSYWPYEEALNFLEKTECTRTVSNIDEELGSHSSSSFSEYESSHSARPQRKKRRYDDETLELIGRATARANETAAGLYAARATARNEDEYDHFGKSLACALRECPEDLRIKKMEAINAVLLDKEPMFVDAVVYNLHQQIAQNLDMFN